MLTTNFIVSHGQQKDGLLETCYACRYHCSSCDVIAAGNINLAHHKRDPAALFSFLFQKKRDSEHLEKAHAEFKIRVHKLPKSRITAKNA